VSVCEVVAKGKMAYGGYSKKGYGAKVVKKKAYGGVGKGYKGYEVKGGGRQAAAVRKLGRFVE